MTEDNHLHSSPENIPVNSKTENLKNTYRCETERIKTFSEWKIDFPVDAVRLAKAGFYYSGNEDEVICFSCKGHIKNWNYGDIVQKKHSELFPNCDFVNNRSNNIPRNLSNKVNESQKNGTTSSLQELETLSQPIHAIDFNKMKSVQERLKSFALSWPFINVRNMADAGFFYLGYEDKVQCPFCKGIVSIWEVGDDPFKEHAKHFPHCNYLCDILSSVNNESCVQNDSIDRCDKKTKNLDFPSKSRLLDKSQEHLNLKKLGVLLHSVPASPQKASFNSRLQSFALWPVASPVSKEYLAKAGFFYIGIKDHTKCFHCDGGLCNWEFGDDPWVEHARWFRNCAFLHLNKGAPFIEDCIARCSDKFEIDVSLQTPHMLSESLMIKVDEAMKSTIVKNVLESTVFPLYIIRATVLRHIKETGSSFSTKDDLCLAVTFLKKEMEKKPLQMDNYQASDLKTNYTDRRKCAVNYEIDANEVKFKKDSTEIPLNGNTKQNHEVSGKVASISKDQYLCIICMEQKVGVVFLPCGHLLACIECASALKLCAMCRKTIQATVRAYLP